MPLSDSPSSRNRAVCAVTLCANGSPGTPRPVRVRPQQQRVVLVEHLLEMRYHPGVVDAVPGEAAGELVVDTAAGHRGAGARHGVERRRRPGALVVPQQRLQQRRRRELRGRSAEAAVCGVLVTQHRPRRRGRTARVRPPGHRRAALKPPNAAHPRYGRTPLRPPRGVPAKPCRDRRRVVAGNYLSDSRCRSGNGRPSGVRKHVIGQPPCPVSAAAYPSSAPRTPWRSPATR